MEITKKQLKRIVELSGIGWSELEDYVKEQWPEILDPEYKRCHLGIRSPEDTGVWKIYANEDDIIVISEDELNIFTKDNRIGFVCYPKDSEYKEIKSKLPE